MKMLQMEICEFVLALMYAYFINRAYNYRKSLVELRLIFLSFPSQIQWSILILRHILDYGKDNMTDNLVTLESVTKL